VHAGRNLDQLMGVVHRNDATSLPETCRNVTSVAVPAEGLLVPAVRGFMTRKLTRLQKAGALVSMAVLVGAWAVAVGNAGLASAINGSSAGVPEVPAMALEQPATVQRTDSGAVNPQAGVVGALSTLSTNGIPSAALYAYHHAETLLADADPQCHLPWNLVAAIGRVESNHGRIQGNSLTAEGLTTPGIIGAALDGSKGSKKVADTDKGLWDEDTKFDRPVGPFQILPEIWKKTAIDSDSDGKENPQDIDDAATTAGVFLCSGTGDLSTATGARSAVQRYNNTPSYVDLVLKVSASYANGLYSQTPDGYSTAAILTSQAYDQTLSEDERDEAREDQEKADDEAERQEQQQSGGSTGGSTGGGTTGGSTGGGTTGGGDGGSDGGGGGDGGSSNPVQNTVEKTQDTVEKAVEDTKDTVDKVEDTVKNVTDALK
jgi:membrane-bound lytic murein transglycosylase B